MVPNRKLRLLPRTAPISSQRWVNRINGDRIKLRETPLPRYFSVDDDQTGKKWNPRQASTTAECYSTPPFAAPTKNQQCRMN
jgi:hypothetical protein